MGTNIIAVYIFKSFQFQFK